MKRKTILLFFIFSLVFFITAFLVSHKKGVVQEPESTLRNATGKTVTFWLAEKGSSQAPAKKILRAGEIYRFRSPVPQEVTVINNGQAITLEIKPNRPWVFREYDEDVIEVYPGSHGRSDAQDLAPFVPTPMVVVDRMLAMVKINKNDILYDLGCGDGRIVIAAAKSFQSRGVGIDLVPERIQECQEMARAAGVESLVTFIQEDVFKVDISRATVVALYLLPDSNELLRPFLERQLKPGVRVISHNYPIAGWQKKRIDFQEIKDKEGDSHYIYLYRR